MTTTNRGQISVTINGDDVGFHRNGSENINTAGDVDQALLDRRTGDFEGLAVAEGVASVIDSHDQRPQHISKEPAESIADYKDKGYSWVIFGAVVVDYFLVAIGLGAVGVLYPFFVAHFQCTMYEAAWIGSLHMAIGALFGLVMSPLLGRFGSRPVTMLGGVIGSLGYVTSYLAQTVEQIYLTFGVLGGIGNGMMLISSSVILQQYFERRRTLVTALATTGFGLSPLVIAQLTRWITATLGWRWAMLLLGCLYLQGAVAGALMKPPPVAAAAVAKKATNGTNGHNSTIGLKDLEHTENAVNVEAEQKTGCLLGAFNMMRSVCRILDLTLLLDISFIVMTLSSSMATFGYFAMFMFLPSHAQSDLVGMDAVEAANLVSVVGFSTLFGRIVSGLVGDRMSCCPVSCRESKERRLFHYAVPMTLAGLANVSVILWRSRVALIMYSGTVGFFAGCYIVMAQPVLIDLLGLKRFAGAFGLFMMFGGIASLACQPFAGWLKDVSGTFALPFLVCGLMQATAGVMLIVLGVVRSFRASKTPRK